MMLDRPDGKKKAYVRLTADHDALDVANKVSHDTNKSREFGTDCVLVDWIYLVDWC